MGKVTFLKTVAPDPQEPTKKVPAGTTVEMTAEQAAPFVARQEAGVSTMGENEGTGFVQQVSDLIPSELEAKAKAGEGDDDGE